MFNGYNDTPPLMSFNDFDQEKEKKQENASKWSYGYEEGGPPIQTPGLNHQPDFWSPKPNFLGNTPVGNTLSKCNCSGCYSTDNQSYQNVSTRHRPWLPKTFPVPLNGSSETSKLPEYHQLDGINLTNQGSCFLNSNDVTPPYFQNNSGKHSHYRYYQNSRIPESNQPGVISSSVNPDFAKKELFQNQKEEIPSNVIGQDLSFLRQNGTRQPVYCNNTCGIIRNVEARLSNRNRGSNICDSLEKYSNVDLYRHPNSVASYSLDQHISRPSVVEPYIKAVPSNLNQNRVPSNGHRNSKENLSQQFVDKVYNENKKNIPSDNFQAINGEKKSVVPTTFQSPLIKEGTTSDNYPIAPLHSMTSPVALNLKNNGIPIDCTYFNINRDFSKPCANLSEGETQKLLYMSERYSDYFSKSNLPDVIKRNNQGHILNSKKECTVNQINQKNYYEQQSNMNRSNIISNGMEYLESNNAKAPFGAFYSKELESIKPTKSEMFDFLQDNSQIFQRKEKIIKNESMNVHPRFPRPAPVFNDPRALCAPNKPQSYFSGPNGETIPFGNFINSDYSHQGHNMQGHHTYSYPHNSVPFQRNDLNQYNNGNLYQQISHSNSQSLTMHSTSSIIFNSQAQPLTNSEEVTSQQFCPAKSQLSSNNIELKSSLPQNDKPRLCSQLEIKKPSYLETIRSEEISKNGNSKISPLRLLRKKKIMSQINEVSSETTPFANSSDSVSTLDVRKFWSTWADEEEENVAPTQVVVLDCQNIGMEEARLLHIYENEPVRTLHLENGNLVTFKESDCDKMLNDNINQRSDDVKELRIQNEQIVNEIKNGSEVISEPVDTSQETIVQPEEIPSISKSFSENLQTEKIPKILEHKTKITDVEPNETKIVIDEELTTHKKSEVVPPTKNETRSNYSQENVEGIHNKQFNVIKKADSEILKLDKWTEKKFDFLKRAEESKAAEILRNNEEKKRIFDKRYSFQPSNFHHETKKNSAEVSNLSDCENSPAKTDCLENSNTFSEPPIFETLKEDSIKNFSLDENSQELLQSSGKGKFSSLPTSEYRRNKFLNYSGKKITLHSDHSNVLVNEKNMTNLGNINNFCDKEKPTDNNSNILNENLPDLKGNDIKREDTLKLEHSKSSLRLKNKVLLDLDEKKFQSQNESSITFAKLKEETGSHNFEMDDILQKISNINFHCSDVKVDSSVNKAKSHEAKPVKMKRLKNLSAAKKIKKSKKLINTMEDEKFKNAETENISMSKPTIKFSIQKLHDLKISFKVLNGNKKYEKCTKDEDIWNKKNERTVNSIQDSNNATELITLKLQSIQRDDKACDSTKLDQKFSRNGILKKKKKRFKRKRIGMESSFTSEIKSHKIKNKKSKNIISEEKDPLAQDSNDEILLNVIEKQSDKYSSSDDFQVQETIDSAKIKLTFKRHKPSFNANSSDIQNISTDHENQSKCISRSSETTNPLCTEKSILKFDSPSEKDLQFIKSEENWFDEFSESYNNLDSISEENQDYNTANFSNQISSFYCNSINNYNNNSFMDNKISPKNSSQSIIGIEDQCDSHGFENTELNENKITKIENEMLNDSDSSTEHFGKVNENDVDKNEIKNKGSSFSDVEFDNRETETETESVENNILNCDVEDSNQTGICDESFMDCGPDITIENENFQELNEHELQVTDPLNNSAVNTNNKDKYSCIKGEDVEKSFKSLIKPSMADAEEEICDLQINSQSSIAEKRFINSEGCSNGGNIVQNEMALINCDTEETEIDKEVQREILLENIEGVNKNVKNQLSDCDANHLKYFEKNNGSYESKTDIKEKESISNNKVDNSQILELEEENILKKVILRDSYEEVSETENIVAELSTPKDNGKSTFLISEISHSEKTSTNATNDKNSIKGKILFNSDEKWENEEAKETIIVSQSDENNSENINKENIERNEIMSFFKKNPAKVEEKKEKIKVLQNEKLVSQNTAEQLIDIEKNISTSKLPECEKQFLHEKIEVNPLVSKNNYNNNISSQCKSSTENVIKHTHSAILNNVICTNTDKCVIDKVTSANIQIPNTFLPAETKSNEALNSNYLKEKLETIKKVTKGELLGEDLHTSEEIIKCSENYESSQMDHVDKGEINENGGGIVKDLKKFDKTEIKHIPNLKSLESKQILTDEKKKEEKIIFSKLNNSVVCEKTEILFHVFKILTCGKTKKIERRNSFTQKNFSDSKRNKIKESQKLKNIKIIPLSENILKCKSFSSEYKTRHKKAKSCPPLEFSYPQISPKEIVTLNIPVEDIPLPLGDPPPENCFDFVKFFKERKRQNAIKSIHNSSLENDLNQLVINGNTDGCLPVDPKISGSIVEDNQNQLYFSQNEISQLHRSSDKTNTSFQFSYLQNCSEFPLPFKTEDEINLVDLKKSLSVSKNVVSNFNSISIDKIDLEEVENEIENYGTSHVEKITPYSSATNKICSEKSISIPASPKSVETLQVIDKKICLEEIPDKKKENEKFLLENIEFPEEFEVKDKKKQIDEITTVKNSDIDEQIINKGEGLETLKSPENSDEFDKNLMESNQIEVVCEDFEFDENEKNLTLVTADEPNTTLEIKNSNFIENKFYECEDIPTSEDLPNDDDIEVEKVSDDDKFRHMMQNCLDNAKKFLNVSNLKLFSCSVEDLLEMDCEFTDVTVEDSEPEKLMTDPTNHISKDVLLTSCDNELNDDLLLSEKFQLNDLSVDFVPSFSSEGSNNLCPEILPVDNWPYLEEEVPSSPTKSKADETDLIPSLENDDINFEKSKQIPTFINHAAFYSKNKLNKIQDNFDKLVSCNIASLPGISHVDFKRFRRRSLVSDDEKFKINSKIGCQRRKTIDCLAGNKLIYSAFNKDMQHFKTEVAKLKSGLEKIEHLWHKSKSLKSSINNEEVKVKKNENKDGKSIKRIQSFRGEAKINKGLFKEDSFEILKSSETVLQREKHNFYFKSPTWQPKVLLFRISKKELKKINKSTFSQLNSKENNGKRISKENFNKRYKDSRQVMQLSHLEGESLKSTFKQQNSQSSLNNASYIKEGKGDKVKAYVKSIKKNLCEEERLSDQLYKIHNFKIKTEHATVFSPNRTFDNDTSPKKDDQVKHCDYSFALTTSKELEKTEIAEMVFRENQNAPVKRKKSRFRNLHCKRKRDLSNLDTGTKIPLKKNLLVNPTLVETELVLNELFKENDVTKDLNLKNKTKSTKEFVNHDKTKNDDGRERKKNRHNELNSSDFPVKNIKDSASNQNIECFSSHLKNNYSEELHTNRNISLSCEVNVENGKHEIGLIPFLGDKKSSEGNLKHSKNENSVFQKRDVAVKKDFSEKKESKYKVIEKHTKNGEMKESRHSDHKYKKKHGREKKEELKFFEVSNSEKKKKLIREENCKKSKSFLKNCKKSFQNVLNKSNDSKSEKRVKNEETNSEGPWICEVCGFDDVTERVTHIKSHPFHCQSCHLAFNTEAHFKTHLIKMHKDIKNQHHCLLCELSFDTESEYKKHLETREHKHLESVEKNTINTLFTLLTGQPCPALGLVEMKPEWLPNQAGMVHFYHQATPLSLALQYLKMHHDLTSFSTLSSVNSP